MKWKCVRDCQGCGLAVDDIDTTKGWLDRARGWAESDNDEDTDNYLEQMYKKLEEEFTEQDAMDFIAEWWELEFDKVEGE